MNFLSATKKDTHLTFNAFARPFRALRSGRERNSFRPTTASLPTVLGTCSGRARKGRGINKTHTGTPPGKCLYGFF